jgi:hypothetical protein
MQCSITRKAFLFGMFIQWRMLVANVHLHRFPYF